jgi:hypothetical protein
VGDEKNVYVVCLFVCLCVCRVDHFEVSASGGQHTHHTGLMVGITTAVYNLYFNTIIGAAIVVGVCVGIVGIVMSTFIALVTIIIITKI